MTDVSVIVSTYNQPSLLKKALLGFACQEHSDFEVIVADDGSTRETATVIALAANELGLNVQHVWQSDRGFRKCRILNKAILAARGSYLIFTDGDCIPRSDFVSAHCNCRRPGHFLSGGYVKLPRDVSYAITEDAIKSRRFAQRGWLIRQGLPRHRHLKLAAKGTVARVLNHISTTRAGWHGHNASAWKADVVRVNGFDERMGYGWEDLEFGDRLVNSGVVPKRIRYSAICVHLFHERPYRDSGMARKNALIRRETRRTHSERTRFGIDEVTAVSV